MTRDRDFQALWGQWALKRLENLPEREGSVGYVMRARIRIQAGEYHKAMIDAATAIELASGVAGASQRERKVQAAALKAIRQLGVCIPEEGLGALRSEAASVDPWITEQMWIYFDLPDLPVVQDWCRWCAEMHLRGEG